MSTDAKLTAFSSALANIQALDLPAFLRTHNLDTEVEPQVSTNILKDLDADTSLDIRDTLSAAQLKLSGRSSSLSSRSSFSSFSSSSSLDGINSSLFVDKLMCLERELINVRKCEEVEFYLQFKQDISETVFPAVTAFLKAGTILSQNSSKLVDLNVGVGAGAIRNLCTHLEAAQVLLHELKQGFQTSIEYSGYYRNVIHDFKEHILTSQTNHTLGPSKFVVHQVLPTLISQFAEKCGTRFPNQLESMKSVYEQCKNAIPDNGLGDCVNCGNRDSRDASTGISGLSGLGGLGGLGSRSGVSGVSEVPAVLAEDLGKSVFDSFDQSDSLKSDSLKTDSMKSDTASTLNSDFSVYSDTEMVFEMKKLRLDSSPTPKLNQLNQLNQLNPTNVPTKPKLKLRPSIPQMHVVHSLGYETPLTVHLNKHKNANSANAANAANLTALQPKPQPVKPAMKPQDKSSPLRASSPKLTNKENTNYLKQKKPFKSRIPPPTLIVNRRVVEKPNTQIPRSVTPTISRRLRLCESPGNRGTSPECSIIETPLTRRGRSPYAPAISSLHVPRVRPRRIPEIAEY